MKLYEINAEIERLINEGIDLETGELTISDELYEMMKAKDEKIENIVLLIKNSLSNVSELKAEKDKLAERERIEKNKVERLKQFLTDVLCGEKFETARCKVTYRKSVAVEIADGTELPKEYLKIKVEPDKTALKDALKNGAEVKGCVLVERSNIQIK